MINLYYTRMEIGVIVRRINGQKEFNFLLSQGEGLKLEFKENFDSKTCLKN